MNRQKVMVAVLLLISGVLTVIQMNRTGAETTATWGVIRDVPKGQIVTEEDIGAISVLPDHRLTGVVQSEEEVIGKRAAVDLREGMIACESLFEQPERYQVRKGSAMTAIKLLPDSAICWICEEGQQVDVYFVDDGGRSENLGEVTIRGAFDQMMSDQELFFFVVVEGRTGVIERIVASRTMGRLEIVKKK